MQPILPIWLIALWCLLALAMILLGHRRLRLSGRRGALLLCLELLVLASALLALLQPVSRTSRPREGACRIVLLGDESRSMGVCDMPDGRSRRQCLASMPKAAFPYRTEHFAFGGELRRVADFSGEQHLPGTSPIGRHLLRILEDSERSFPLGAVVLLSDGACNSGTGVIDAAKEYMRRGIPISCVGIGGEEAENDYSTGWQDAEMKVPRDSECVLTALVGGNGAARLRLVLSEAGTVLEERELQFKGGTMKVPFTIRPRTEGFHSYKISVSGGAKETRLDNNAAFAAVEAVPPPTSRMLFLLGGLDWEQRFINQFTALNPRFTAASMTAVSKGHFISSGFPEDIRPPENSFPQDTAFYDGFDIVVLDARALPLLGERGLGAIRAFVENKGGGLLLRGPLEELPEVLSDMLPAREAMPVRSTMPAKLLFRQDAVFGNDASGLLASGDGIFLKPGDTMFPLAGLKKSARPLALLDFQYGSGLPLVAGMPFGAGRIIMTGLESTWRWRLAGNPLHDAWWSAIFQWLADAAKPRIRELNGRLAQAGNEFRLELSVLDDDFSPAPNALVTASVRGPDGTVQELALEAAADEEGRYSALLYPEAEGEYLVSYRVALPSRSLSREAFFVASLAGPELEDTDFRQDLLRDVARITGGRYFTPDDFAADKVPISRNVPAATSIRHLASTWTAVIVFAIAATALCLMRRRFGLK